METSRSLAPVSETALGMALIRAEESLRPDCLFDDPYAEAFLAAAPDAFADKDGATTDPAVLEAVLSVFRFQGVIRTRFFDDQLLAGCASGCRQVVLLAAGLDTRAYRLAWPPGVRVFELDLPEVLTFKDHVLAGRRASPRCERTTVPADLHTRAVPDHARGEFITAVRNDRHRHVVA
jgi:methyltransferase (TIGR00027 family)